MINNFIEKKKEKIGVALQGYNARATKIDNLDSNKLVSKRYKGIPFKDLKGLSFIHDIVD